MIFLGVNKNIDFESDSEINQPEKRLDPNIILPNSDNIGVVVLFYLLKLQAFHYLK